MKKRSIPSETHEIKEKQPLQAGDARAIIDRMILLAEETIDTNPEQAVLMAQQAAAACRMHPFGKKPYLKGLAKSYHASASAYLNQGAYGQALKFHSDSLTVYKEIGDRTKIASQLNNIGIVYAYCGDYAEALKHMRAAETFCNDHTPTSLKSEILNNIGFTHVVLGDFASAVPILLASLETAKKIKGSGSSEHLIAQANIFDSLCQAYLAQNELAAALKAGLKSTSLAQQCGDLKKEAEYLLILGEVYRRMENPALAENNFQRALALARDHGFRREEAEAYRRLGTFQRHQGNFGEASRLLADALAIATEIKMQREVYECHLALSGLYKATGEFEKALDHFEHYHLIKESVFNDQSDQRIKNLEILHQVEQARREAEIHQQKSIELQKEIVERKKAHELTEILASTDALTGIYNRRHFFTLANQLISAAIQAQTSVSVIILDVDHFKMVNDRYGHLEGDRTLAAIAHKISALLRAGDIVGRYGGEEFAIALPQTKAEQGSVIAERLRAAVEQMEISPVLPELKVTISLGIASLDERAQADTHMVLEKLLDHADQAMYHSKKQGRNQVSVYSD